MDNLLNIKKYLMEQIDSSTNIMARCKSENNDETSYHFECERRAYLNVLDYVTYLIRLLQKGGE